MSRVFGFRVEACLGPRLQILLLRFRVLVLFLLLGFGSWGLGFRDLQLGFRVSGLRPGTPNYIL